MWFRRDLRLADHPALLAAAAAGPVVGLFVLDPALLKPAGASRAAFVLASLEELRTALAARGGTLLVRRGDPREVVPAVARELGAASVHVSADFGPYGVARDAAVARALGHLPLVRTGSPYAVTPGRLRRSGNSGYRVFSAFLSAWLDHGWPPPAPSEVVDRWAEAGAARSDPLPWPALPADLVLPPAGEEAARRAWARFIDSSLASYDTDRDRPGLDATSRLSPYLKVGSLHPRTLLAALGPADRVFRQELAWREFFASVLYDLPASARHSMRPELERLPWARGRLAEERFDAWAAGRTGYPLVDAGMRQLLAEGWMHNRVRMVAASFLVKDLHLDWRLGARHFLRHLVDGDLASNQHGWQWVAGTGTDAAPFFRVFNPVTQARRFDPDGAYIRRWVPELAGLPARLVHEPWKAPGGPPAGYAGPIVDHAAERRRALEDFAAARERATGG